jgi:hypothetical protein
VELRVPADTAYVAVLRTTTAGLAARLDFTLDDIEDLRIAVGEACAMVLEQARDDGDLNCAFDLGHGDRVRGRGPGRGARHGRVRLAGADRADDPGHGTGHPGGSRDHAVDEVRPVGLIG